MVTVTLMLDNGYPILRKLDLQSCGIGDDLIEMISPVLSENKSLNYLTLHNHQNGARNMIGERGGAALCNAVHDISSFKKTFESNHTILKLTMERGLVNDPERILIQNNWHGGLYSGVFGKAWKNMYHTSLAVKNLICPHLWRKTSNLSHTYFIV